MGLKSLRGQNIFQKSVILCCNILMKSTVKPSTDYQYMKRKYRFHKERLVIARLRQRALELGVRLLERLQALLFGGVLALQSVELV